MLRSAVRKCKCSNWHAFGTFWLHGKPVLHSGVLGGCDYDKNVRSYGTIRSMRLQCAKFLQQRRLGGISFVDQRIWAYERKFTKALKEASWRKTMDLWAELRGSALLPSGSCCSAAVTTLARAWRWQQAFDLFNGLLREFPENVPSRPGLLALRHRRVREPAEPAADPLEQLARELQEGASRTSSGSTRTAEQLARELQEGARATGEAWLREKLQKHGRDSIGGICGALKVEDRRPGTAHWLSVDELVENLVVSLCSSVVSCLQ
eukprot:s103_g51.t1